MAEYRGGGSPVFNELHIGGGHSLFRQSIGGDHEFFRQSESENQQINTRRGYFFYYCCKLVHGTVQKTMLQHVQSDIIHIFVCLEKGEVNIFFLTPRHCLSPTPLR